MTQRPESMIYRLPCPYCGAVAGQLCFGPSRRPTEYVHAMRADALIGITNKVPDELKFPPALTQAGRDN